MPELIGAELYADSTASRAAFVMFEWRGRCLGRCGRICFKVSQFSRFRRQHGWVPPKRQRSAVEPRDRKALVGGTL